MAHQPVGGFSFATNQTSVTNFTVQSDTLRVVVKTRSTCSDWNYWALHN